MHVSVSSKHILAEEVEGILVLDDVLILTDIGENCAGVTAYQNLLTGGDSLVVV